jgi:hypothetical protein
VKDGEILSEWIGFVSVNYLDLPDLPHVRKKVMQLFCRYAFPEIANINFHGGIDGVHSKGKHKIETAEIYFLIRNLP